MTRSRGRPHADTPTFTGCRTQSALPLSRALLIGRSIWHNFPNARTVKMAIDLEYLLGHRIASRGPRGTGVGCTALTIRTSDPATLATLSSFHFCRAFRSSSHDSPHSYLMRRRVERAQGLMMTTENAPRTKAHAKAKYRFVDVSPYSDPSARAGIGNGQ